MHSALLNNASMETRPQITLYQAFVKDSNLNGISDINVIKRNFIKFAVLYKIGFKIRDGGIVIDDPDLLGVDFIDILVKCNKKKGLNLEEIIMSLCSIGANFNFDGKDIVSAREQIPLVTRKNPPNPAATLRPPITTNIATQDSTAPHPMVKTVPQPIAEKRVAEQNTPAKRVQLSSITMKRTIELCAFEYQKDSEAHYPLAAIQSKFGGDYSFVLNNVAPVGKNFAIQIVFSDHPNFPKNLGIVRVGILDHDEPVPQFMSDAGCYIYLRYNYELQKFSDEHNGLKRLGKLFTLNNETIKKLLPDAVVKRRATHSQSSEQ